MVTRLTIVKLVYSALFLYRCWLRFQGYYIHLPYSYHHHPEDRFHHHQILNHRVHHSNLNIHLDHKYQAKHKPRYVPNKIHLWRQIHLYRSNIHMYQRNHYSLKCKIHLYRIFLSIIQFLLENIFSIHFYLFYL